MDDWFTTIAGPAESSSRVRGSTFHALAAPVGSDEEARSLLAGQVALHHDASHHCAGWRLRTRGWRTIDAGEPAGSAGAPILTAIDALGLVDCAVVVTRYFGGTKLGIGGLVRAYGAAAASALERSDLLRGRPAARVRIEYGYDRTAVAMRAAERFGDGPVDHGYAPVSGRGSIVFTVAEADLARLVESVRDGSGGQLEVEVVEPTVTWTPIAR